MGGGAIQRYMAPTTISSLKSFLKKSQKFFGSKKVAHKAGHKAKLA